jgi:hypothetical protein
MEMKWKIFRPVDGVMGADGCGQIITATTVRSLDTVIQYVNTGLSTFGKLQEMYIQDDAVDALGFGLICNSWSNKWGDLPAWAIGTRQQVATLRKLEPTGHCSTALQNLYHEDPDYNLRIEDLVAMLMPMVYRKNTILTHAPAPSENMLGFTQSAQGRSAFSSMSRSLLRCPRGWTPD